MREGGGREGQEGQGRRQGPPMSHVLSSCPHLCLHPSTYLCVCVMSELKKKAHRDWWIWDSLDRTGGTATCAACLPA